MDVRPATRDDIAAVQAIDEALGQRVSGERALQNAIDDGRVQIAWDGDSAAGYVRWEWFWDRIPLCVFVRVRAEARRRGLGRALYAAVEPDLRSRGCTFWLSSTEEDNETSMRFHVAMGFRRIGALTELEQDSAEVFFRKDL